MDTAHTSTFRKKTEASRAQRAAANEAVRMQAAGACKQVKVVVNEQGWVVGNRTTCARALLDQVVLWFGKPKQAGNTGLQQMERVKALMGWQEGVGFP